jgi:FkbM family methyltransferase
MIKVKGDGRFGPMIYMENDIFVGRAIESYGENDYHAIDLLARLVSEDDVIVDVGAYIGTFTVPFARLVPKGYVIAFEAQPIIFNILGGNIAINNLFNVTLSQRAVSNSDGVPMYIPSLDYGKDANFAGIKLLSERDGSSSMVAHTIKIDGLNLGKLKILKIDVEGMELEVLDGAKETIKRTKPIIYVEAMPEAKEKIESFMNNIGYQHRLHEFPMFNKDNHAKKSENTLQNPGFDTHVMVSPNLLCYPPEMEEALSPLFQGEFFKEKASGVCPIAGMSSPPVVPPDFAPTDVNRPNKNDISGKIEASLELPKVFAKEE